MSRLSLKVIPPMESSYSEWLRTPIPVSGCQRIGHGGRRHNDDALVWVQGPFPTGPQGCRSALLFGNSRPVEWRPVIHGFGAGAVAGDRGLEPLSARCNSAG